MFGDISWEIPEEGYTEYLLADEAGVRVLVCIQHGAIKLYRIEWIEP